MAIRFEKFIFQIVDRCKNDENYENRNDCNRNKKWLPTSMRRSTSPGYQNGIKFNFLLRN